MPAAYFEFFFICNIHLYFWPYRNFGLLVFCFVIIFWLKCKYIILAYWFRPYGPARFRNSVVSFFTQSFVSNRCFIFHPIFRFGALFHFSPNHLRLLFPFSTNHSFPDRCFIFHPKFGGGKIWTSNLPIKYMTN